MSVFNQEELKEWDQCILMLDDAKVDEHGNLNDTKDSNIMYLDKDGEDHEINVRFSLSLSLSHIPTPPLCKHCYMKTWLATVFNVLPLDTTVGLLYYCLCL